ncbi:MAG TPA: septal ring lytic transglycosylase RlpA family protein [Solirubrobacteraceae bacterium]
MNRTLANKTLLAVATALVCALSPAAALASIAPSSAGGASAPSTTPAGTPAKPTTKAQIATWFGPGFYGQQTACGQTMTPVIVGVASRTLPCGTLVLVGYKGHQLTVPVIDRGPYAHGATWDLTWGAASALTITETVRVKTKIVGQARNSPLLGVPAESLPTPEAVAAGGTAPA